MRDAGQLACGKKRFFFVLHRLFLPKHKNKKSSGQEDKMDRSKQHGLHHPSTTFILLDKECTKEGATALVFMGEDHYNYHCH